jgi:uncharacterized protein YlxW (UPF0749 family)
MWHLTRTEAISIVITVLSVAGVIASAIIQARSKAHEAALNDANSELQRELARVKDSVADRDTRVKELENALARRARLANATRRSHGSS